MLTALQQKRNIRCDACYESIPVRIALQLTSCKHQYCAKCVSIMFGKATKNEAEFPPSCCSKTISLKDAAPFLHRPQITAYEKSAAHFNTPITDRRYCATQACSSFLGRANNGLLRCDKCYQLTCEICKKHAHTGDCTAEPDHNEQLQRLLKEEGWQECSTCGRIVDLRDGCNHITSVVPPFSFVLVASADLLHSCPCTHQFCYLCAVDWKTCNCPQYGRDVFLPDEEPLHAHRQVDLIDRWYAMMRANNVAMEGYLGPFFVYLARPHRSRVPHNDEVLDEEAIDRHWPLDLPWHRR